MRASGRIRDGAINLWHSTIDNMVVDDGLRGEVLWSIRLVIIQHRNLVPVATQVYSIAKASTLHPR